MVPSEPALPQSKSAHGAAQRATAALLPFVGRLRQSQAIKPAWPPQRVSAALLPRASSDAAAIAAAENLTMAPAVVIDRPCNGHLGVIPGLSCSGVGREHLLSALGLKTDPTAPASHLELPMAFLANGHHCDLLPQVLQQVPKRATKVYVQRKMVAIKVLYHPRKRQTMVQLCWYFMNS